MVISKTSDTLPLSYNQSPIAGRNCISISCCASSVSIILLFGIAVPCDSDCGGLLSLDAAGGTVINESGIGFIVF